MSFSRTQGQLYDEERRLRLLAESQVRSLIGVLTELALVLVPEPVEARRRDDPSAFRRMEAKEWQTFFREELARKAQKPAWVQSSTQEPSAKELSAKEPSAVVSLEQPPSPEPDDSEPQTPNSSPQPKTPELTAPGFLHPVTYTPIPLPSKAPKPYSWKGDAWHRRILILAVFATTGWAMRLEMLAAVSKAEGIGSSAGSLKRMVGKLVSEGYLHHESARLGESTLALHWLTDTGKRLVESVGIVPISSEWEELLTLHGGERQLGHAVHCLTASHQARQHGYATQVCPPVAGSAAPDLLLVKGDERIYLEVEAESGEPERRMIKWRNQAALQGFVALCAPTPEMRSRLVAEAIAAKTKGMATDLKTGREKGDEYWVERW
ncbi:MAG: hypothetical protein KBG20_03755 [Caldilineaceae bacterium]|nr:hypothetical protein [Caldilineaceae bacterium]MBP8106560.1 hypothetical protein [Caldilineaceae bacterium]MBP8121582.1 hypothetical protein [Caldilineaceae bacterium]MBP9071383.1 hypothetical protein [Caldilineaceae bacterium]